MSSPGLTIQLVVAAMLDHIPVIQFASQSLALDKPKRMVHIIRMFIYLSQRGMDATLVTARIDSAHKGDSVGNGIFDIVSIACTTVYTPVWNPSLTLAQQVNAKRKVLITSTHFVFGVSLVVVGLVVVFVHHKTVCEQNQIATRKTAFVSRKKQNTSTFSKNTRNRQL